MKIYELPRSDDIAYYVGCSIETAQQIFFSPGPWWEQFYYIACFDQDGNWVTEYQVFYDEKTDISYMETEY